jgi:hypothetical protein
MTKSGDFKVQKRKKKMPGKAADIAQDKVKEQQIQVVIKFLSEAGVNVRREKLKKGAGWSVNSGAAAVFGEPTIFVDRNLALDDQLEVLVAQVADFKSQIGPEDLKKMPESMQRLIVQDVAVNDMAVNNMVLQDSI